MRGRKHLLKNIQRRKPIHSHSIHTRVNSLTDTERQEFEQEIKRLKHDKSLLQLELQKHERENQVFESQISSLNERFQNIEYRQMKLIALLAELVQKPGYASLLMQQSEIYHKKKKMLNSSYQCEDSNTKENWSLLKFDHVEKLDSSLEFWENIFYEIGETVGGHIVNTSKLPQASPVFATEFQEIEINCRPYSPVSHLSSPKSIDVHMTLEIDGSENHIDSPTTLPDCLNVDISPKSSQIDMNSEPSNPPEHDASKQHNIGKEADAPTKVNDLFWEQCLTETPCSSNKEVAESGRRDVSGSVTESNEGVQEKGWWNVKVVDNLTKMGHLTPAL